MKSFGIFCGCTVIGFGSGCCAGSAGLPIGLLLLLPTGGLIFIIKYCCCWGTELVLVLLGGAAEEAELEREFVAARDELVGGCLSDILFY